MRARGSDTQLQPAGEGRTWAGFEGTRTRGTGTPKRGGKSPAEICWILEGRRVRMSRGIQRLTARASCEAYLISSLGRGSL